MFHFILKINSYINNNIQRFITLLMQQCVLLCPFSQSTRNQYRIIFLLDVDHATKYLPEVIFQQPFKERLKFVRLEIAGENT